jgi:peptidoglycan hydrolase CwlO-like protein
MPENFVEDRIFNAEIRRLDSDINGVKKAADKYENNVNASINRLEREMGNMRQDIKDLRKEVNDRLWWIFEAVILSILAPVVMRYL